jgi:transposase-like protein
MAPRRDGGADQRQTILALASGRRRGEILDLLVQRRRDARLMRKLLKKRGFAPALLVTDKLRSYGAARTRLRLSVRHEQGLRKK